MEKRWVLQLKTLINVIGIFRVKGNPNVSSWGVNWTRKIFATEYGQTRTPRLSSVSYGDTITITQVTVSQLKSCKVDQNSLANGSCYQPAATPVIMIIMFKRRDWTILWWVQECAPLYVNTLHERSQLTITFQIAVPIIYYELWLLSEKIFYLHLIRGQSSGISVAVITV